MKNLTVTQIETLLAPAVEALGYEWWGCVFEARARNMLLRIYIDKPGHGITVDDCEAASHQISGILAVNDPLGEENYTLEVSSPGLDRKLFTLAQFARFVGETVKIRLRVPLNGQRNFQAVLLAVDEAKGEVVLRQKEGGTVAINFANIERTNIVPDFSKFN